LQARDWRAYYEFTMKNDKLIEIREGAGGKSAYVGRTRIRVLNIMTLYQQVLDELVVERALVEYPQLTGEHVYAALEYGRENVAEMEKELADDMAAYARLD
jgi:uncharacterized protein (DUF433 family)